jgi:SnoaL-like domain
MSSGNISDMVRRYFSAYETKNRQIVEDLLDARFIFTSPNDDHINRTVYFNRCWPFGEKIRSFTIERLLEQGSEAIVRYVLEFYSGEKIRNTEFFRFEGDKIVNIDVYFGRKF